MRANTTKAKWHRGEVTFGAWLSVPSSYSAEIVAQQPFDWVCIDMQHGVIDFQAAVTMLQAISTTEATPIVRVPWNEFSIIGRVLDAGAMGIIVPMVNSVDEARAPSRPAAMFPPARAATARRGRTSTPAPTTSTRERRSGVHPDDRDAAGAGAA